MLGISRFTFQHALNVIASKGMLIAANLIPGWSSQHKFGHNTAVGTSFVGIDSVTVDWSAWTADSVVKISSGSVADDVGSTGALEVTVYGWNSEGEALEEAVAMDGRTEVLTTLEFYRIYRLKVTSVGTGGVNAGIIYAGTGTVTTGVPATVYYSIPIGYNQSMGTHSHVPKGYKGFILDVHATTNDSKGLITRILTQVGTGPAQVKHEFAGYAGSSQPQEFSVPKSLDRMADVYIDAKASASGAHVAGGYTMILIKDKVR